MKRLAELMECPVSQVHDAADELREALAERGLMLIRVGDELELRTAPETADLVKKLREGELHKDLGRAGLEALAIILYRGNATRSEIDWIRGVNSSQTLRSLMLRGLVNRTEDAKDKRKFRYQPTTDALAHLGVGSIEDLPRYSELSKDAEEAVASNEYGDA